MSKQMIIPPQIIILDSSGIYKLPWASFPSFLE